jgi:ribosomal protein L37AE/L43A
MPHTCPRCGGEIRPQSATSLIGVCGTCRQEFYYSQPHTCPRCGGEIRPQSATSLIGVCGTCRQEFYYSQPGRPLLTPEDWAVLRAHDESEAKGGE